MIESVLYGIENAVVKRCEYGRGRTITVPHDAGTEENIQIAAEYDDEFQRVDSGV